MHLTRNMAAVRLAGDTEEIEANVEKVRGLVLRNEFVRKA